MGKDLDRGRGGINVKAAQEILNQKKKEKSNSGTGGFEDKRWFKFPATGEAKVRFLPPIEGEQVPGMVLHKHYNLPEIEGLKGNITCFKTWGLDCPICAVIDEYKDEFKDKLEEFYGSSAYFNVLVLDQAGYDPTLAHILQSGEYNYEWVLSQVVNMDVGDITHVTDGANVTFRRKKAKGAFDRIISRRSSAIADTDEKIDDILDSMYDFKKIWREPDDNYFNLAEDLADLLRDIIKERLLRQPADADKDKPVKEVQDAKRRSGRGEESKEDKKEEEETPPPRNRRPREEAEDKKEEEAPAPAPRTRRPREEKPEEKPEEKKEEAPAPRTRKPREEKAEAKDNDGDNKGNKVGGNKPANAPDCFGKEHNTSRKCNVCSYEYDCENNS